MFVWQKNFELGIEVIDEQHQKLFQIANEISELITRYADGEDTYDEIISVIGELKEYTVYHFKTEEDLFLKYNYPDYTQHKKEHHVFIEHLDEVVFLDLDHNQEKFLRDLLNMIAKWVLDHILTQDFKYKDFLLMAQNKA
ncbi:MAG: bacteriohemerythrin [Desulfotomaculum sp.]|nr:bacteriohemerythrin [Desulfotomaculum sp.]